MSNNESNDNKSIGHVVMIAVLIVIVEMFEWE